MSSCSSSRKKPIFSRIACVSVAKTGCWPDGDQRLVQLRRVRQVEVPAEGEVARGPRAAPEVGVAGAQVVAAARPVAQVTEEELAAEVEVASSPSRGIRGGSRPSSTLSLYWPRSSLKILSSGFDFTFRSRNMNGSPAGDVELHAGNPGAVLAPVVLLLHQEEQLGEAPERRAVLLLVVGKRLEQPHEGDPAFVADQFAHALVSRGRDASSPSLYSFPRPRATRRPPRRGSRAPSSPSRTPSADTVPIASDGHACSPRGQRRRPAGRPPPPRGAPCPGSRRRGARQAVAAGMADRSTEAPRAAGPKSISQSATRSPPSLRSCAAPTRPALICAEDAVLQAHSPPLGRPPVRRPSSSRARSRGTGFPRARSAPLPGARAAPPRPGRTGA